jgi:hypothetical protein
MAPRLLRPADLPPKRLCLYVWPRSRLIRATSFNTREACQRRLRRLFVRADLQANNFHLLSILSPLETSLLSSPLPLLALTFPRIPKHVYSTLISRGSLLRTDFLYLLSPRSFSDLLFHRSRLTFYQSYYFPIFFFFFLHPFAPHLLITLHPILSRLIQIIPIPNFFSLLNLNIFWPFQSLTFYDTVSHYQLYQMFIYRKDTSSHFQPLHLTNPIVLRYLI